MTVRRMSSRRVALTASFLALAAGGAAACDSPEPETFEYETVTSAEDPYPEPEYEAEEEYEDEVFYCADEEGTIVDEENCDDGFVGTGTFLIWHSASYSRGLTPGTVLDADGDSFSPTDRAARKSFNLPATGPVTNGTIKTGVVGKSGGGSAGS